MIYFALPAISFDPSGTEWPICIIEFKLCYFALHIFYLLCEFESKKFFKVLIFYWKFHTLIFFQIASIIYKFFPTQNLINIISVRYQNSLVILALNIFYISYLNVLNFLFFYIQKIEKFHSSLIFQFLAISW
jgi:hypothetical protein